MGGWIILILSFLVILYCVRSLYRVISGIGGSDKIEYWNGPAPKEKDRQIARQQIVEHISEFPSTGLVADFPELAEQAHTVKLYNDLQFLYETGQMDEIDYQIALDKITSRVDITELLPPSDKPLPQRFF